MPIDLDAMTVRDELDSNVLALVPDLADVLSDDLTTEQCLRIKDADNNRQ